MVFSRISRIIVCLFIVGRMAVSTPSVIACTPTVTPTGYVGLSFADHVNAAQVIVDGTITAITQYEAQSFGGSDVMFDEATIQVQQYLKGNEGDTINIRGFGYSTACMIETRVGDQRLFYAVSDGQGAWSIYATYSNNADNIAQIQEIVAQSPGAQVPSTPTPETIAASDATTSDGTIWWYALALLAGVLVIIIAMYIRTIRR